ncbi:MAG: response regulator, partial [Casimicrobiaceae bacterium]|nr:response regulator [Casimicrobiaceae bacterium]
LLAIARGLTRIRDGWTPPNGWAPRQNAPEALAQFETPSSRAGIAPSTPAATAEKAAAADVHGQPAPFEPLGTLEILVVDDSAEALASIVQVLKRHGHRVHAVTNATEALARAREARFDLVLVDYDMPGRDGPATVRALRQLTSPKAQPIIAILSTKPGWVPRWRSRRAGADGFFAKPARLSEVLGLVAKRQTEQRRDSHAASVAVGASSPTAAQSNRPLFKTDKVNPNANTPRA